MPSSTEVHPVDRAAKHIENTVAMPEGAAPLDKYHRYYIASELEGRDIIMAQYHLGDHYLTRSTEIKGLDQAYRVTDPLGIPFIRDGGCGVVNLIYDIELKAIVSVDCNGSA